MVALLPVVLALGLACSRRDLARQRSDAPVNPCGRGSRSASSPVEAKNAKRSCAVASAPEVDGKPAFGWLPRGGGTHGKGLADGAGVESVVVPPGRQENVELQQYSVALARTHLLRRERDRAIKEAINPLAHMYLSVTQPGQHNKWMSSPLISNEARQAQKRYLLEAGRIIRSTGLTTSRYNELSRIVCKRKDLRDRVWRQANLYRTKGAFAAPRLLHGGDETAKGKGGVDIGPGAGAAGAGAGMGADDLQGGTKSARGHPDHHRRRRRPYHRKGMGGSTGGRGGTEDRQVAFEEDRKPHTDKQTTMRFAKSLREIEALRLRRRRRLMDDIGCEELPAGLCLPSMGRVASPRVRKECQTFPAQSESIVEANGLTPEAFNRLSSRTRGNLLYRWLVCRCVRQLEKAEGRRPPSQ